MLITTTPLVTISICRHQLVRMHQRVIGRMITYKEGSEQHSKTGESIRGHIAKSDDIKVRACAVCREAVSNSAILLDMDIPIYPYTLEDRIRLILEENIDLYLSPTRVPESVKNILMRFDSNPQGRSSISRAILQKFSWHAEDRPCPRIGDRILISIRHRYWGLGVLVEFWVESDPNLGVIVGEPAYSTVLTTWHEHNKIHWLLTPKVSQPILASFFLLRLTYSRSCRVMLLTDLRTLFLEYINSKIEVFDLRRSNC